MKRQGRQALHKEVEHRIMTILAVMVFAIYIISAAVVFIAARKGDVSNDRNGQ